MDKNQDNPQPAQKDLEKTIEELEQVTKNMILKNGIPVLNKIVPLAEETSLAEEEKPLEKTNIPVIIFDKIVATTNQKISQELDGVIDNLKEQIKERIDQELKITLNPVSSKSILSSLRPQNRPK